MCESKIRRKKNRCCVKVDAVNDALQYEEREEEVEEEEKQEDIDVAFESLVDKYGMEKVMDTLARKAKKD